MGNQNESKTRTREPKAGEVEGRALQGRAPTVALCGASRVDDPEVEQAARELGAEVAKRGWTLVCGGMGGVMAAACRGLREARAAGLGDADQARCVGILPCDSPFGGNAYLDVVIPTGLGMARNALVVKAGDAVVLANGASGTLSEAAMAWQLNRPMVALARTGGWAQELARRGTLDHRSRQEVFAAESVAQAMDHLDHCFRDWERDRGIAGGVGSVDAGASRGHELVGIDPSRREPPTQTTSDAAASASSASGSSVSPPPPTRQKP